MAAVMTTQEALITDKCWYELNSLTTRVPKRHFRPALSICVRARVCVCEERHIKKEKERKI